MTVFLPNIGPLILNETTQIQPILMKNSQYRQDCPSSVKPLSDQLHFPRMCHRLEDIMELCCELSADKQIQTTVKGSGKGAATAGGLAFAGGLVGGPLGIAVGGAIGGLLGCWLTSGQFKPLPQVIMELSPQQQQKLYADLVAILGDIQWTDVVQLTGLVMSNISLKQQLTAALLGFVTKELQANVHYVD